MKRQSTLPILFVAFALLLAACSGRPVQPTAPEIHYGEDMCSDCGMIITEPRFAASYAAKQGEGAYETFIFDDIGDMLHHMQQNLTIVGVGWWVHDYDSQEWIDATTAYFVVSDQIKTPMNHGTAAFGTQTAAEKLASEVKGQVFDWDKIRIEHALAGHQH
jgi:copper chaperone NosL